MALNVELRFSVRYVSYAKGVFLKGVRKIDNERGGEGSSGLHSYFFMIIGKKSPEKVTNPLFPIIQLFSYSVSFLG